MKLVSVLLASLHAVSLAGNESKVAGNDSYPVVGHGSDKVAGKVAGNESYPLVGHGSDKVAGFETNKWEKQRSINKAFCGTESYELDISGKWCRSWWLPPQRWDTLIINSVSACAVCAYASVGAGCVACGQAEVARFFTDLAKHTQTAVKKMGEDIRGRAERLLSDWWNDILRGKWYFANVDGWRVEARGGWETYRGRECALGLCGPWTSLQTQAYIQVHVTFYAHWFYVKNSCHEEVQVAIRYKTTDGQWVSACWYKMSPGQGYYLGSGGDRLITENKIWYYYAEATNGGRVWSGQDTTRTCRGRSLNMKEKRYVDSDGDLYLRLTCNNAKGASEVGEDVEPVEKSEASANPLADCKPEHEASEDKVPELFP